MLITEYDASGNLLRKYVHGSRQDEPLVWFEGSGNTDVRFLHADHQGSIIATTNSAGTVVNINTYDAYGLKASSNATYASRFSSPAKPIRDASATLAAYSKRRKSTSPRS